MSVVQVVRLVVVLHCAKCGSTLDIKKGGHIWAVRCYSCDAEILVDGRNKDLFDAYAAYTDAITTGRVSAGDARGSSRISITTDSVADGRDRATRKSRAGRTPIQSRTEIQKLVENGGSKLETLKDEVRALVTKGNDYLVTYRHMPQSDAEYGSQVDSLQLPTRLKEHLQAKGIKQLYSFQEEVYNSILKGNDVVISAPTAQGKTEAFILPIVRSLVVTVQEAFMSPGVRALLIYPTKALAKDQYSKIKGICESSGLTVAVFDGDVSQSQRSRIYESPPDVLLTNPDILHYHLGWDRSRLVPLLHTVKYVVVDEIHLYTGSMGANVYYVLKRLELEAGQFQKIGASATIANPKEFAEQVFDGDVHLVESVTAKRGPIHFMMYYPEKRSKYSMIVDVVQTLQSGGFKTLVFGNTHSEAEVLNILINDLGIKSMVHRAGLPKKYRSQVETDFKAGRLSVLVSTPTLELGVDIGHLDSVVSMITSITRLTQRIGRAGRMGQESVAILALRENDPISSFYKNQPEKYFTDVDAAYMEPQNEIVGYYQLIAAAMSGKLNTSHFPQQLKIIETLERDGLLHVSENGSVRVVDSEKARKAWRGYSIRGIGDTVQIKLGKRTIGDRSMPMAAQSLHPGAIYLHGGNNLLSVEFKYAPGFGSATVVSMQDRTYHTRPLYSLMPRILSVVEERKILGLNAIYCSLEMTQTVHGYVKKETRTGRILGKSDLPESLIYKYITRGFAFTAPEPTKTVNEYSEGKLKGSKGPRLGPAELYGGAFHALEHVVIESSDMLTGGSTREIGGVSMGDSGIIFVYDGSPGGNGASKLLFSKLDEAFRRTETILATCDCKTVDGCPLCTYSYQCGNNNRPLFKAGALESVRKILGNVETSVDTKEYSGYQPVV